MRRCRGRRQNVILSGTNSRRECLSSRCSAVGDLTASSRTLHPGKLTRWTGADRQTPDDRSPVSPYHRRTGEGEDHIPRWGRSGPQYKMNSKTFWQSATWCHVNSNTHCFSESPQDIPFLKIIFCITFNCFSVPISYTVHGRSGLAVFT